MAASMINNQVKKPKKNKDSDEDDEDHKRPIIAKTPVELQRLKLEKLLKNPEKPAPIPERPRDRNMAAAPDFVRNVMGSSAGAGSGEFHVYRHLRRKEYARQKFIQERAEKDKRDDDYHRRIEENKQKAEDRTAKKRAKRQKKKDMKKNAAKKPKSTNTPEKESDGDDSSDGSGEEKGEKSADSAD